MTLLFPSPLVQAAEQIRILASCCDYDHRPHLPAWDSERDPRHLTDAFARGYAAFKFAVAAVLQPGRIVEIGVWSATAARAFLSAWPEAHYIGIDSESERPGLLAEARDVLAEWSAQVELIQADSLDLELFPACDLVHVDGCHDSGHAYRDTLLALQAAPWVLVDDCRNNVVAAAALAAARDWRPGDLEYAYFEDTWTGSILFHREMEPR